MNKEELYIGQKIKLPQESYDYSLECYGDILDDYAEITSLENLESHDIVHYKIKVLNPLGETIHSGINYNEIKKYE